MSDTTKRDRGPSLSTERLDDVLIIWIDVPGEPVKTLGPSMVGEFETAFATIEKSHEL